MVKETKRERFKRVAENRTNKIITLMQLLGNCANKNNYDYTEKDVKLIIDTLEEEIKILKNKFNYETTKKRKFTLE